MSEATGPIGLYDIREAAVRRERLEREVPAMLDFVKMCAEPDGRVAVSSVLNALARAILARIEGRG